MTSIAFVVTCKGRLHHLKQSLPLLVASRPTEIVVVDYGCPDGAGDWVEREFAGVKLVRVDDDPFFCLSRARNKGAAYVESDWICFIDADVLVSPGWSAWTHRFLQEGCFYKAGAEHRKRDRNIWGTVLCQRSAFNQIAGYDEIIRGWGGEDDDLYLRLRDSGLIESYIPPGYLTGVSHSDNERTEFHENKNRAAQRDINHSYIAIKRFLADIAGVVDTELKREIYYALSREVPLQRKMNPRFWRVRIVCRTRQGEIGVVAGWRRRFIVFGPRVFFLAKINQFH